MAEREQRLADLRRQQAEAQALEELLSAAARQASAGDVAGAHQRYREVLAREPGHEAAQQALRDLARMQEGRVLDRLDAGQLEPAARELAVLRELRASLALEDTLERLEERFDVARAAQQRELGVAERLAEARQLEAMGDILRAYARYQEVLDLEAEHAEASAAQVRLVRSQREEVEQALAAGRVEAAERALARYRQLSEALPEEGERLAGLEAAVLYPGHGPVLDDPAGTVASYLAHRRERERQVLAALERGAGTPKQIVAGVYADVDPVLHPAAERSVRAHLDKLVADGVVSVHAEGGQEVFRV